MCAKIARENLAQGFTLIELLICLVLMATIFMFSAPLTSRLYQQNQIQVIQDNIQSAIRFAKTQALVTGKNMLLTPLPNSMDWSSGILMFADNEKHVYTPTSQIVHEWHWQYPAVEVSWYGFQSNQYLLFSIEASRNAANGYFLIKSQVPQRVKLVVNRMGRVRVAR